MVAYGVDQAGQREVIGLDVGAAETEAFWREFLRSLVRRGLAGVQLVVSDAHEGLKQAIAQVLGAPWQRCTVHFLRDALGSRVGGRVPSTVERLGPWLPLQLHEAPDLGAVRAAAANVEPYIRADGGQVDAEHLHAPVERRRDRLVEVGRVPRPHAGSVPNTCSK